MHWLQALDTSLFDFINRSLANSFCDWLMPVLSGNALFFPAVFLLGVGLLWKGNVRLRLCLLLLLLILPLGDSLVTNTIKHAVARPRPFVTLPEARLFGTVGKGYIPSEAGDSGREMSTDKGSRTSMPSSHAANWFAATMILFIFYRRSLWFMLPMALAVSLSRVYNGVHYPSDVLVGAILGAGYAAAGAIALQAGWRWIGKKWFPVWHVQLPSLLNAETQNSPALDTRHPTLDTHWLRLGYIVIFVMLIARWLYIASGTIELEKDEAYQWLWSKHLALSYYSKPPGIALIQFAGTSLWGDTQFGIRFFPPLFAAILSVMVLRFFAREVSARAGFWLLLIVTAVPLPGIGTILITPDPPMVLCWMWALVAGWRAAQPEGKTRDWLVVGLAMGLGFLCKYTAACQIACWAIFFALWPATRVHLRRPGPWLALLIFLVCTTPVIIWNAQHGWITAYHVAGNAGLDSRWQPTMRYFWDFLFVEAGLLNPIFFVGALWAMFAFWKQPRHKMSGLWLYFFCMGAPVFLGYWLYSFHSRILPNWIAPAVVPMFCLMVAYWDERRRIAKPFLATGLALGFFAVAILFQSNLIGKVAGQLLPGEKDPLRRVRAWRPTAALIEGEREKLAAGGKPAFIIADHYGMTGLFTFYLPQAKAALQSGPLVYCVDSDEPKNQLYFWPEYDYRARRQGQNAIYVSELDPYPLEPGWFWKWLKHQTVGYGKVSPPFPLPPRMLQEFESVTDLGEFEIKIGNRVFRRVHLWACHNLR
ncbi:MAG: glycosyltransferase family 39 protein [Verrucomicrobiota bacterium]|jgi:4-amino-4-deoxy-L-arabinose transferase-like glycosyltransferase/membrane-associated phospholipid phosphatase